MGDPAEPARTCLAVSSGRSGTAALCAAIDAAVDADAEHEPEPRLLREAWRRHVGLPHRTPALDEALEALGRPRPVPLLRTVRHAPLLEDLAHAAPATRFVLLVREPWEYVRSAATRGVLVRGDDWDVYRLLPLDRDLAGASRAELIGLHWAEVQRWVLRFAAQQPERSRWLLTADLDRSLPEVLGWLGWRFDGPALAAALAGRPNAGGTGFPDVDVEGSVRAEVRDAVDAVWAQVQTAAGRVVAAGSAS